MDSWGLNIKLIFFLAKKSPAIAGLFNQDEFYI